MSTRPHSPAPVLSRRLAVCALSGGLVLAPAVAHAAPSGSPEGELAAVRAVAGGVEVTGWAVDPDSSEPLTVTLMSGSVRTTAATSGADEREFTAVLATGPGEQEVCATAVNVGDGADTTLSCRTLVVPPATPFGNLDEVSTDGDEVRVRGWVADLDDPKPVTVVISVNGDRTWVAAQRERVDVPRVWPGTTPNHGFDVELPLDPGANEICVLAKNVGPGENRDFGCTEVDGPGAQPAPEEDAEQPAPAPKPEPAPAPKPAPEPAPAPKPAPKPAPAPEPAPPAESSPSRPGGKPGPDNTGVPSGVRLERHDGNLVITRAGTVIDGLDIRGFVDVRAADVTIKNSVIRGGRTSTSRGLVTVSSSRYSLTIVDSELAASTLSPNVDGLRGMNITARRLNIHRVVDSAHVYGSNVLIEDSWLHDNAHWERDPNWGGTPTHDDNVQIQRGSNITLRNNNIGGSKNAAIMLTQDAGAVSNLRITDNWLDGGACVVNIKSKGAPARGVAITDNTFGRNAKYPNCGIKVASSYPLTLKNNVFTNGRAVSRTP